MILVDTSVWVDHLRGGDAHMEYLLEAEEVLMHPFVLGEIALGYLPERKVTLMGLQELFPVAIATDEEVLTLIESVGLIGSGIGYIDAHLLASARLTHDCQLWTRDKRLARVAEAMGLKPKLH